MNKMMLSVYKLRQARSQPMWKLIASDDAANVMSILKGILGDQDRLLKASVCLERVSRALEMLRQEGEDLKQGAKEYIALWVGSGWLNRRIIGEDSEESYELSAAAQSALRWSDEIAQPRTLATESRLSIVIEGVVSLANETNPDSSERIALMIKSRDELDVKIRQGMSGNLTLMNDQQAKEALDNILEIAKGISGDFSNHRENLTGIDRTFRRKLIEGGQSRHEVLNSVFSSIEILAETDSGKSFLAFWKLLIDPVKSELMESAVQDILKRKFAQKLPREDRIFLGRLSDVLMSEARGVHSIIYGLSKSLKTFVQSREYKEHQRIRGLITDAQKMALKVSQLHKSTAETGYEITLPVTTINSVTQGQLRMPESMVPKQKMVVSEESNVSIGDITAQILSAEIDMATLIENIRDALSKSPGINLTELSEKYPMNQGLGSLLGYMQLATKHAFENTQKANRVTWTDQAGNTKTVKVNYIEFTKESAHDLI